MLREVHYKDSSKILTVLTRDEGKMTVSVPGALRKNSRLAAPTQLLIFSCMTLRISKGRATLCEAESIESFLALRGSVEKLALGAYIAETLEAFSPEGVECAALLELGLNILYALTQPKWPETLLKAVYEWRLAAENGLMPQLSGCAGCGEEAGDMTLHLPDGALYCVRCRAEQPPGACCTLTHAARNAARYVMECSPKRLLSFVMPGEQDGLSFAEAAEKYLLCQAERGFRTLDFYKSLS